MSDPGWFTAWVLVGCALALGVVSFALGPLVLIPAAAVAVLMVSRPRARRSAYGALTGAGLLLVFVAYLNREGPGTTCWQRATSSGCSEHLNPLPWLLLGVVLVAGGLVAHRQRRH
ncbi:MAG: hypothetical protein QOH95_285 [Gaiellaceae bacterium]|nr:hypothetical protein [Gaiellaceae bacterium]